jgi:integrase
MPGAGHKAAIAVTFVECAELFIESQETRWSPRNAKTWARTLSAHVYPTLGDRAVNEIDQDLVINVIEPMWTVKPRMANRIRGLIGSVLDFATAIGYREGDNPARWRGHLEYRLPSPLKLRPIKRCQGMHYREIAPFVAELRQQDSVAARALEFAILTAARASEVNGATWDQIDLDAKVWTMQPEPTNSGGGHCSPLSDAALKIIAKLAASGKAGFIFPDNKTGQPMGKGRMLALMKRIGRADATVHGFRYTFAVWAVYAGYSRPVVKRALGHVDRTVTWTFARADHLPEHRQMMEAWAQFCGTAASASQ